MNTRLVKNLWAVRAEIVRLVEDVSENTDTIELAAEISKIFYDDSSADLSYGHEIDVTATANKVLAHYIQHYMNYWPDIESKGASWLDRIFRPKKMRRFKNALWDLREISDLQSRAVKMTGVA